MAHSSWKNASEGNVRHRSVSMYDTVSALPNAFSSSRLLSTTSTPSAPPPSTPPSMSGGVDAFSVLSGRLRFFALKRLARSLNIRYRSALIISALPIATGHTCPRIFVGTPCLCTSSRARLRILGSDQRGRMVFVHSVAASSIALSRFALRFVSSALTRSSRCRRFCSSRLRTAASLAERCSLPR